MNNLREWGVVSGECKKIAKAMLCSIFLFSFALFLGVPVRAQQDSGEKQNPISPLSTLRSPLQKYLRFAHPIATVALSFPGPSGGYTLLHLPTKEVTEYGDTIIKNKSYLLDLNVSHDGLYLAPDTMLSISDFTPFEFVPAKDRIMHAKLAPSHSREEIRQLDTTFNGVVGLGFIKQFVTAFDLEHNTVTFYPLYANLMIADDDTNTIQLPILDDAKITYCGCPSPNIWLDVQAPPLNSGHVSLAFNQPESQVFESAFDSVTRHTIAKQRLQDSLSANKRPIGLKLGDFIVGKETGHAINIAFRSPKRLIEPLPAMYHDLNVPVLGTLGTDALRTFKGIIIDPSRNKLIFIK